MTPQRRRMARRSSERAIARFRSSDMCDYAQVQAFAQCYHHATRASPCPPQRPPMERPNNKIYIGASGASPRKRAGGGGVAGS